MGANDRQVGGDHYKTNTGWQHWDAVVEWDLDYFQAMIIRYAMRHKNKDRLKDLRKCEHFIQKYIELYETKKLRYGKQK